MTGYIFLPIAIKANPALSVSNSALRLYIVPCLNLFNLPPCYFSEIKTIQPTIFVEKLQSASLDFSIQHRVY